MSSSIPPQAARLTAPRLVRITQYWGGAALMLGNLLFILNKLDEMSQVFLSRWMRDLISGQTPGLILLGQVALIIGYVAYARFYTPRAGGFGRNALRLFCGGGILLAVGHVGFIAERRLQAAEAVLWMLVVIGLMAMLLGLLALGIANLRQQILGRWRWLPLVTALMGLIGFFGFGGEESRGVFLIFRTLFALGLIGLGLALWLERPAQPEAAR
jgi:hypothetical protein